MVLRMLKLNHKELDVWKRSKDLVIEVYNLCDKLPQTEKYILAQQLKRAAISVSSNIAEGFARKSNKETKRFLDECKPDIVVISVLYIFPQTKVYEMAKDAGIIDDDFWLTETPTKPYTVEHPLKELYRMRLSVIIHYELSRGWLSLLNYFVGQIKKSPGVVLDHLKNLI